MNEVSVQLQRETEREIEEKRPVQDLEERRGEAEGEGGENVGELCVEAERIAVSKSTNHLVTLWDEAYFLRGSDCLQVFLEILEDESTKVRLGRNEWYIENILKVQSILPPF